MIFMQLAVTIIGPVRIDTAVNRRAEKLKRYICEPTRKRKTQAFTYQQKLT